MGLRRRLEDGVVERDQLVGDPFDVVDLLDVAARRSADLLPAGGPHRQELLEPRAQRLGRRVDDRHGEPVGALRPACRLLVEERHDGLAERHAFDREQAVPAGVQLVDDDVGVAVALQRLVVMEALDDAELDVELLARSQHMVGPLPAARGRGVDDHGASSAGRWRRRDRIQVDARGDHGCLGHPADRVEAADDLGASLLPVRELLGRLAADVRAEVVHDRALAKRAQNRKLERLRDERQPEREVEQVGCRQELAEHLPLRHLSAEQASVKLERPVGLRVQRVAVEDDELRVDPAAAERLHVRPRHTRRVDRAVDDAERAASHRAPGSVPGED